MGNLQADDEPADLRSKIGSKTSHLKLTSPWPISQRAFPRKSGSSRLQLRSFGQWSVYVLHPKDSLSSRFCDLILIEPELSAISIRKRLNSIIKRSCPGDFYESNVLSLFEPGLQVCRLDQPRLGRRVRSHHRRRYSVCDAGHPALVSACFQGNGELERLDRSQMLTAAANDLVSARAMPRSRKLASHHTLAPIEHRERAGRP